MSTQVFRGDISGIGTSGGTRIVVGHWPASPLGDFTDVMVQFPDGERVLLAPSEDVSEFVTATYNFDRIELVDVRWHRDGSRVHVTAGDLTVSYVIGRRTLLGILLALVPDAVVTAPWFCTFSDPVARVVMSGVRTKGTAGGGRREYYGAKDQHRIVGAVARWRGDHLGSLTDVTPPVTFGFGSTPPTPSLTTITTTIVSAQEHP